MARRYCAAVAEFNEMWWEEILHGSVRDQLSFDYVRWQLEGRVDVREVYAGEGWRKRVHPWFEYWGHG